jgi:hypothetical protein
MPGQQAAAGATGGARPACRSAGAAGPGRQKTVTALAVARETQDSTGLAICNVIRQLRPLRSATTAVNGAVQSFPTAIDPEQQKILNDLKNGRDLRH